MTLLDEKIAALFRKSSPISTEAEPAHPLTAEEAASEAVLSEPAGEEVNATRVDDQPSRLRTGLWQSKQAHHGRHWI